MLAASLKKKQPELHHVVESSWLTQAYIVGLQSEELQKNGMTHANKSKLNAY